mmetsp:Transcript_67683/g.218637  ORF Transcript_67683/g.218637 Transcript_67683/m.218637 type:complete len:204 (-) Transcript_67683:171-782(-)
MPSVGVRRRAAPPPELAQLATLFWRTKCSASAASRFALVASATLWPTLCRVPAGEPTRPRRPWGAGRWGGCGPSAREPGAAVGLSRQFCGELSWPMDRRPRRAMGRERSIMAAFRCSAACTTRQASSKRSLPCAGARSVPHSGSRRVATGTCAGGGCGGVGGDLRRSTGGSGDSKPASVLCADTSMLHLAQPARGAPAASPGL